MLRRSSSRLTTYIGTGLARDIQQGYTKGFPTVRFKLCEVSMKTPEMTMVPVVENDHVNVFLMNKKQADLKLQSGDIVHIVGRLALRPSFVAETATFDYTGEVSVSEEFGNFTLVKRMS